MKVIVILKMKVIVILRKSKSDNESDYESDNESDNDGKKDKYYNEIRQLNNWFETIDQTK